MNALVNNIDATHIVALHLRITDAIREAALTLRYLPDKEAGFLSSGSHGCMPTVIRGYWEAYGQEPARKPRMPPSPGAIDRMYETLDWLCWLGQGSKRHMEVAWLVYGVEERTGRIARTLGISPRSVQRLRREAIERIVGHIVDIRRDWRNLSHQITP